MAVYTIASPESPFGAVEFSPVSGGNLAFFYVKNSQEKDRAIQQAEEWGQSILSEAQLGENTVLITRGSKTQEALMEALKLQDGSAALKTPPHKTNWWAFRGNMSNAGQALQLYSSLKEPSFKKTGIKPKYAADQGMFAIMNLAANMVNIVFGGEKEKDPYRLANIKENQNKLLVSDLADGAPDISASHAARLKEPQPPPSLGKRLHAFMRKNSVTFGEIGLRFLGSLALVLPAKKTHWQNVSVAYKEQGLKAAARASLNRDNFNLASGATYLVGKTLALFSKTPDPYNPKPPSGLRKIREQYVFRTASVIETGAAGILAYGNMKKGRPVGAVGGTLFMGGLVSRIFAPFGERELNMDEVFAYTTDMLAGVPRDRLPQLVTKSAAQLSSDLMDHPAWSYGAVYTRLMNDLYRYHDIALDACGKTSGEAEKTVPPASALVEPVTEKSGTGRKLSEASAALFADQVKLADSAAPVR